MSPSADGAVDDAGFESGLGGFGNRSGSGSLLLDSGQERLRGDERVRVAYPGDDEAVVADDDRLHLGPAVGEQSN